MKSKKNSYRNLVLISQLGIQVMVPIFLCLFLGMVIDDWLSTSFCTLILLFLGILAGGRNAYILAMSSIEKDKRLKKDD